jgi:predicted nucleic acid-binding protein
MMSDERFAFGSEPPELEPVFRHIMRGVSVSPKVWQDAYLAAFTIAGGLTLVTFDGLFSSVAGLELTLLG